MKRLIAKLAFNSRSDSDALVFGQQLVARMTGNTNFPNSVALVTSLGVAADAFATALQNVSTGTVGTTAAKNAARADLFKAITLLASHVEDNSGTDLAKFQSSGFEARKAPVQHQTVTLGLPVDLMLTQQRGGNLHLKFKKAENSVALEMRHRAVGDDVWSDSCFTSGSECTLTGFVAGTQYEVQTRAIGKSKAKDVSETTSWATEMFWAI
jgi:hypothetical protein